MNLRSIHLPSLKASEALKSAVFGLAIGAIVAAIAFPLLGPRATHTGNGPVARLVAAAPAATPTAAQAPLPQRFAGFSDEMPSPDARFVADWIADSRDNRNLPFVIVDKRFARVHVFDKDAQLVAATPILLGAAPGDDSVPGIGQKAIEDIPEHERTTPAGRFMGQRGINARHEDVVWVDYGAAVSMHRVVTLVAEERRQQRLDSPQIDDNRVSWGCINVPVAFFETHIAPLFVERKAPIYVLPEVKAIAEVFPASYDVALRHAATTLPVAAVEQARRPGS